MGSRKSPRVYQKFKKKLAQEKDLLKIIIGLFFYPKTTDKVNATPEIIP